MKRSRINPRTRKTTERNKECFRVFMLKLSREGYKCVHCKKYGNLFDGWNPLTPHHVDHNRNNNEYDNIQPMHLLCQTELHSQPRDKWELYNE